MKAGRLFIAVAACAFVASAAAARAAEIRINHVYMPNAPTWLYASRVDAVVKRIMSVMDWQPDEVKALWYATSAEFQASAGIPGWAGAYARESDGSIHLGPAVTTRNFEGVFGHEFVHVIVYQHYRGSIPGWLNEGLANYIGQAWTVDYRWLATQPRVHVKSLVHALDAGIGGPRYHYMASTAVMEMIASHCRIEELLRLSVGDKLESWLASYCHLGDLDEEFGKWLQKKAR